MHNVPRKCVESNLKLTLWEHLYCTKHGDTFITYITSISFSSLAEAENKEYGEEELRDMESKAMEVGKKYREEGNAKDLGNMIKRIRPFTKLLSKAKAAKLIRGLVDMYLDMDAATGYEVQLCEECIQWATEEKRIFLRQVRYPDMSLTLVLIFLSFRL